MNSDNGQSILKKSLMSFIHEGFVNKAHVMTRKTSAPDCEIDFDHRDHYGKPEIRCFESMHIFLFASDFSASGMRNKDCLQVSVCVYVCTIAYFNMAVTYVK